MIDLHCHMLPGIDDGARDLETALQMARLAVADGITLTACTPHIYPGRYDNTHEQIRLACEAFQQQLIDAGIPLKLTYGADIQVAPEMTERLLDRTLPTLHNSRYFLFEPPHHVALPRLNDMIDETLAAGFVPVITHPERLFYAESEYDRFIQAARNGAWIQLTGGSLLGKFGRKAKALSLRFLKDGYTHLLASDGHNLLNRTPELAEARAVAARYVGEMEADRLVMERPEAVIDNRSAHQVVAPPGLLTPDNEPAHRTGKKNGKKSWFSRLY